MPQVFILLTIFLLQSSQREESTGLRSELLSGKFSASINSGTDVNEQRPDCRTAYPKTYCLRRVFFDGGGKRDISFTDKLTVLGADKSLKSSAKATEK